MSEKIKQEIRQLVVGSGEDIVLAVVDGNNDVWLYQDLPGEGLVWNLIPPLPSPRTLCPRCKHFIDIEPEWGACAAYSRGTEEDPERQPMSGMCVCGGDRFSERA